MPIKALAADAAALHAETPYIQNVPQCNRSDTLKITSIQREKPKVGGKGQRARGVV